MLRTYDLIYECGGTLSFLCSRATPPSGRFLSLGVPFEGFLAHTKDYTILGSILGFAYLGKPPNLNSGLWEAGVDADSLELAILVRPLGLQGFLVEACGLFSR